MAFRVGLECLTEELVAKWGRIGLLANQASLTDGLVPAFRVVGDLAGSQLRALFGPQHGFMGVDQYNMIETSHGTHIETGLPVFSLYAETRKPTAQMLDGIDTLVIDLQISGCRIYTWKATIDLCLEAAKEEGKKIVILDRPNPVGGKLVEGRVLERAAHSFVGCVSIPMRHGLTTGEVAQYINQKHDADLEIVNLEGWNPDEFASEWERPWVLTSPMLPTTDSVSVYPGMVMVEGTNLSEGRGTTLPFQLIGAPYITDARKLINELKERFSESLAGLSLREASFQPTWNKWQSETCNGFHILVEEEKKVKSYDLCLAIIKVVKDLYPGEFAWEKPGYEYDFDHLPIDLLIGSFGAHKKFDSESFNLRDSFWNDGVQEYLSNVKPFLLYERSLYMAETR